MNRGFSRKLKKTIKKFKNNNRRVEFSHKLKNCTKKYILPFLYWNIVLVVRAGYRYWRHCEETTEQSGTRRWCPSSQSGTFMIQIITWSGPVLRKIPWSGSGLQGKITGSDLRRKTGYGSNPRKVQMDFNLDVQTGSGSDHILKTVFRYIHDPYNYLIRFRPPKKTLIRIWPPRKNNRIRPPTKNRIRFRPSKSSNGF